MSLQRFFFLVHVKKKKKSSIYLSGKIHGSLKSWLLLSLLLPVSVL